MPSGTKIETAQSMREALIAEFRPKILRCLGVYPGEVPKKGVGKTLPSEDDRMFFCYGVKLGDVDVFTLGARYPTMPYGPAGHVVGRAKTYDLVGGEDIFYSDVHITKNAQGSIINVQHLPRSIGFMDNAFSNRELGILGEMEVFNRALQSQFFIGDKAID